MAEQRYWVSSYNYCQNNPVNRIDPNGMLDDTKYVDEQGNELHHSEDELEHAIVVVSDDQKEEFVKEVESAESSGLEDDDGQNTNWRKTYGTRSDGVKWTPNGGVFSSSTYMVGEFWEWERKHTLGNLLSSGLEREHAIRLVVIDGEIRINPDAETIPGDFSSAIFTDVAANNEVARIHSHVNVDNGYGGANPEYPSDTKDRQHRDNRKPYYNVIVTKNTVTFYNRASNANTNKIYYDFIKQKNDFRNKK